MELGEIISFRRKHAKMTIDELSAKSNVPKGTLNKIIAGTTKDPQLETVKAIARALNCTLEDLDNTKTAPPSIDESAERHSKEQHQNIHKQLEKRGLSWARLDNPANWHEENFLLN